MNNVTTGYKRVKGLKTTKKYKTPEEATLFQEQTESEWRNSRGINRPGRIECKSGSCGNCDQCEETFK